MGGFVDESFPSFFRSLCIQKRFRKIRFRLQCHRFGAGKCFDLFVLFNFLFLHEADKHMAKPFLLTTAGIASAVIRSAIHPALSNIEIAL